MSAMPNPTLVASADGRSMRVEHRGDDKFDINIRGHVVRVDQPVKDGGEDTAPTPTELFIASLASCVAFYARACLRLGRSTPAASSPGTTCPPTAWPSVGRSCRAR